MSSKAVIDYPKKSKKNATEIGANHAFLNEKHLKCIPADLEPKNLFVLYLHNNSITQIDNLSNLCNLTHLYLQWNAIRKIENLRYLINLKKLYLGNNRISVVENLEDLKSLKELHLEKQNLDWGEILCFDPRCLSTLSNRLEILNISDNKLSDLSCLETLTNLRSLIAQNNKFANLESLLFTLKKLHNIRDLDLRGNSICTIHRYREITIATCLRLDKLDTKQISPESRHTFKCFIKRSYGKGANKKSKKEEKAIENTCNESPDMQLAFLESQRAAASLARLNRLKNKDSVRGAIPRCFWRNKAHKKIEASGGKNASPFDNFLNNTNND